MPLGGFSYGTLAMMMASESVDIEKLKSVENIQKVYDDLCNEETEVSMELSSLLEQQSHMENKMTTLQRSLRNLQLVRSDAQQLSSMISFASTLAENVSGKVRRLDLAKSRVTECSQHVEDILDLKFCTDGVKTALQNENYEQAAVHIHRFSSLDENILKHAACDVSEGNSLDTAFSLLRDAQSVLKDTVIRKFDESVRDEDLASVERFFKIFPLLNQHEEGLKKFSKYLCSQIAETAQKNLKLALGSAPGDKRANVIFADTVTLLFEGIARVIEIHQPLVETYYGHGQLLTVVEMLQKECDRQLRRIIEEFKRVRNFEQKTFLVQQLLTHSFQYRTTERVEPRELDVLLGELTLLNARAELYLRFIRRRLMNDIEVLDKGQADLVNKMEKVLKDCDLSRKMQELLGQYIMLEEYFLRESVTKAVSLDSIDEGSVISSMMDDVFFIIKKCIRRSLSSCSVDVICAVINYSCTVLESDFCEVLHTQLRLGFPSGSLDLSQAYTVLQQYTSMQQGKASAPEPDKARIAFLTTINNGEVAVEYIQTLKKDIQNETYRQFANARDQEKAKLESCLSDLNNSANKFKELVDYGMKQLSTTVVKPRIKPWVDSFFSVSHDITEDEFSNYEANDPFVQNLIINLENLLLSFKQNLTPTNYDSLVTVLAFEVSVRLEKSVLKSSFNRLGGLQFDRELRALLSYLTSATTWSIRDKFARLSQMTTILNLDKVEEINDYWGDNSGSLTWRLTPHEVRQVLSLRVEFKSKDVKRKTLKGC
uniref:Conserved oligomeric Golgi complex subunit 4 n=1 Tax=Strigamia maritima TaxID=126957 RepID=T1J554_STRMM